MKYTWPLLVLWTAAHAAAPNSAAVKMEMAFGADFAV